MTNKEHYAFPVEVNKNYYYFHAGLTKREYFAAMAMQGLLANSFRSPTSYIESNAEYAVNYADALIAELNK
jgi:hypothetical protein